MRPPQPTPSLILVEATVVCIPIGSSEIHALVAALYESPGRAWSLADFAEILGSERKIIFAGDLDAQHPF
jgi:hypothetical protein